MIFLARHKKLNFSHDLSITGDTKSFECWTNHINTSIFEGPSWCLNIKCMVPSCHVNVGEEMISELASDKARKTYSLHLGNS